MQSLYAFQSNDGDDVKAGLKDLFAGIDKVYELYYVFLYVLKALHTYEVTRIDKAKLKQLPTEEDLKPNIKFLENQLLVELAADKKLNSLFAQIDLNWLDEELIKNIYVKIRAGSEFKDYIHSSEKSLFEDSNFISSIFKKHIAESDLLLQRLGEESLFWEANIDAVASYIIRTLLSIGKNSGGSLSVINILGKEEKKFITDLFTVTSENSSEYAKLIGEKAKNWEADRIATMDILLMKMAIAEILKFPTIPVKVSMNEYIEISKYYSAEQSRLFINGILDKLVAEFRKNKKIKKLGRGLVES